MKANILLNSKNFCTFSLILFFQVVVFSGFGQFTSVTSGDWNDGATWGNTSPGVAGTDYPGTSGFDDVIISAGNTVTLQQAESIFDFTIDAGGIVNAGSNDLEINGNATLNGTFNAGTGTVTFAGIGSATLIPGGNSFNNVVINKPSSTPSQTNTGTIAIDASVSGAASNAGNVTTDNGSCANFISVAGQAHIWQWNSGTFNIPFDATIDGITVNVDLGGRFGLTAEISPEGSNFGTSEDENGDNSTNCGGTTRIYGNGGTLGFGSLTPTNINDGLFLRLTTFDDGGSTNAGVNVDFISASITYTTSGSSSLTLTDALDVNNDITLTAGTLDTNGNSMNVAGDWVNSGSSIFTNDNNTVIFDGSAADQEITSGGQSFYNLIVNNSASSGNDDILLQDALDIDNNLTITDGDLNANGFDITNGANWFVGSSGLFTSGGSNTVTFDGSGVATIRCNSNSDFYDLVINSTAAAGSPSNTGAINVTTAVSGNASANGLSVGGGCDNIEGSTSVYGWTSGLFNIPSGSTIQGLEIDILYGGRDSDALQLQLSPDNATYGTIFSLTGNTNNNPGCGDAISRTAGGSSELWGDSWTADNVNDGIFLQLTESGTRNDYVDNIEVTVYYSSAAGGDVIVQDDIIIDNDITIASGVFKGNGQTTLVAGNWSSAPSTFTPQGATVEFNGSSTQTIDLNANSFFNLRVNNASASIQPLDQLDVDNNLTIAASSELDLNGFDLNVGGDWSNSGTFTQGTNTVTLDGSVTQSIDNSETFYDLEINNSQFGTSVLLNNTMVISNSITFTDGIIETTSSNLLTVNGVSGANDASYVQGPVAKENFTGLFEFPIGDNNRYRPASVTPAASSSYTVAYSQSEQSRGVGLLDLNNISSAEFWVIDRTSGSGDGTVTLSFDDISNVDDISGTPPSTDLRVARFDESGSDWRDASSSNITGSTTDGTITSATISDANLGSDLYYTLGSLSPTSNFLDNNRYLVATGDWTDAVWAYDETGTGGDAPTPTASNFVFVQGGFTVTLVGTSDAFDLSIDGSSTLAQENQTLNVYNDYTNDGSHTINNGLFYLQGLNAFIDGSGSISISGSGNVRIEEPVSSSTADKFIATTADLTISGGNLVIADDNIVENNGSITLTNDMIDSGPGASWIQATNSTLNIEGALFTTNGTGILEADNTGNTVNYNGSGAQEIYVPFGANYYNLTLSTSGVKSPQGGFIILNDLTTLGTATLALGSTNQSVAGDLNLVDGSITAGSSTLRLNGSSDQSFTGEVTLNNLTINKSGGKVNVNSNVTVGGTLTLTQGIIDMDLDDGDKLDDPILSINPANVVAGSPGTSNHVEGIMSTTTTFTTAYAFPVGDNGNYRPVTLNPVGAESFSVVQHIVGSLPNGGGATTPNLEDLVGTASSDANGGTIESVLGSRYWRIEGTGTSNATIQLDGSEDNFTDETALRIANLVSTDWAEISDPFVAGSNPSGTIFTIEGQTDTFGEFGILSVDAIASPLPVELIEFSATVKDSEVDLRWSTATETDNDKFILERSYDFDEFESIGIIQGNGTTNKTSSYSHVDRPSNEGLIFYRLTQIDYDGSKETFQIISVDFSPSPIFTKIFYPNPVESGSVLKLDQVYGGINTAMLYLTDLTGKKHKIEQVEQLSNVIEIAIPTIVKGIYFLQGSINGIQINAPIVVK